MGLNKGEWSEIYTFFMLLAEGKIYSADSNLNRITDSFYPILKILRTEPAGALEFSRNSKIEVLDSEGKKILSLDIKLFKEKALELFTLITNSKGSSFEAPAIVRFLESIKITQLKAGAKEKRDITLVAHDSNTGLNPTLGFSIKSKLGSPSTLINAGKTTNFIFQIDPPVSETRLIGLNQKIDSKELGIKEAVCLIFKQGSRLKFTGTQSLNFSQNLKMIDSLFPSIVAEIVLAYFKKEGILVSDLLDQLEKRNPCDYDLSQSHPFYQYKFRNFLAECALGMTPNSKWSGKLDANGGYIVVKEDGDILCYHLYNMNEFKEYLFHNTKLETASSTRNDFGRIYQEDGKQFIKLNLQIRFK